MKDPVIEEKKESGTVGTKRTIEEMEGAYLNEGEK